MDQPPLIQARHGHTHPTHNPELNVCEFKTAKKHLEEVAESILMSVSWLGFHSSSCCCSPTAELDIQPSSSNEPASISAESHPERVGQHVGSSVVGVSGDADEELPPREEDVAALQRGPAEVGLLGVHLHHRQLQIRHHPFHRLRLQRGEENPPAVFVCFIYLFIYFKSGFKSLKH